MVGGRVGGGYGGSGGTVSVFLRYLGQTRIIMQMYHYYATWLGIVHIGLITGNELHMHVKCGNYISSFNHLIDMQYGRSRLYIYVCNRQHLSLFLCQRWRRRVRLRLNLIKRSYL